jgi:hypothetical protein
LKALLFLDAPAPSAYLKRAAESIADEMDVGERG